MSRNSAASSLYSGIFTAGANTTAAASSSSSSSSSSLTSPAHHATRDDTRPENDAKVPAGTEGPCGTSMSTLSKPQAWSAALRFAPRRNVNAGKAKRPIGSAVAGPSFAASSVGEVHATDQSQDKAISTGPAANETIPRDVGDVRPRPGPGAFAREQDQGPPEPRAIGPHETSKGKPILDIQTKAITVGGVAQDLGKLPAVQHPPELSISVEEIEADRRLFAALAEKRGEERGDSRPQYGEDKSDEDVNGFGSTAEGQKARKRKQKRRRHTSPGRHGGLAASLKMDADYDTNVPNDYGDFKALLRKRREAIKRMRKQAEAEDTLARSAEYPGQGERYGSDSDDDDGNGRQRKLSRFAPPSLYNHQTHRSASTQMDQEGDDDKLYISLTPPPSDAPSYSHSATISTPPSSDVQQSTSRPAESGEEAYLRRVAMSQPTTGQDVYQQRGRPSQEASTSASKTSSATEQQYNSDSAGPIDFASRAAAAAAIAARLIKSAKPVEETEIASNQGRAPTHTDPSTFAERLMMKQGWKQGEALGSEGNKGMLDPILAEKTERDRNNSRGAPAVARGSGPRGTIVNAQEEAKRREERARFGEPSEIILLENMIAGDHEIDDELATEIGDECAKHGYVDRVFIWSARKAAEHGHIGMGPRIFVCFSGMAGAWRCLKELDGRFFGGRTVAARYYPPHEFAKGHYGRRY